MILTWPTLSRQAPESIDWSLVSNTQSFSSPLSKSVQTVEMPGGRWRVTFTLDMLDDDDAALLQGFMAQLRGRSGRFRLHNMARPLPRGPAGGTPVVAGAAQTGNTLQTSGWTPSAVALKIGDYFGVNDELKMIVAEATADGSGNATLTFEPPLRDSPGNGATITTDAPTAIFMLEEDESLWRTAMPVVSEITISAMEAW